MPDIQVNIAASAEARNKYFLNSLPIAHRSRPVTLTLLMFQPLNGRVVMNSPLLRQEPHTLPPLASTSTLNDEELSDQQIYQLLKDAEQRPGSALNGPSGTSTMQNQSSISSLQKRYSKPPYPPLLAIRAPRKVYSDLPHSLSTRPDSGLPLLYIKMTSQGAQVDLV